MLRRLAYVSAVILLALLAVLFTVLNPQEFDVDLAFARFEVSAGLALLIAFSAGLLGGALWRSTWIARLLAERGVGPSDLGKMNEGLTSRPLVVRK